MVEIDFKEIQNTIARLESKIDSLLKQKSSDKLEQLQKLVIERGNMSVPQVRAEFNLSRPWALELMRKLGRIDTFSFRKGSKSFQYPSRIVYNKSKEEASLVKIATLVTKTGSATMRRICEECCLEYLGARRLAELFVANYPNEYYIDESQALNNEDVTLLDGVKLVKKAINS